MRLLLGAAAAFALFAAPSFAQITLPAQCSFTAAPAIPDGAAASNNAMRRARQAFEAWRATRAAELAACQAAATALQNQAQAAAAAHNAGIADANAAIERFTAENAEYSARSSLARRAPTRSDR